MKKSILLAPNSFKECADSVEIASVINKLIIDRANFTIIQKPLSDGGDGFLSIAKLLFSCSDIIYSIIRCYEDQLENKTILFDKNFNRIFIESANLFGLKVVPEEFRNPMKLNSNSLGSILKKIELDVINKRQIVDEVIIGIGGTATLDFGIGACSQLGLKLFDKVGKELVPIPQNFSSVAKIIWVKQNLSFKVKCIVDVETDLIGNPGALEIYGKQKGASDLEIVEIKAGIKNLLNILKRDSNFKIPEKLNGAGGGLAAGLNLFLGAEIIKAEDFILNYILEGINLNSIDAVITGEGRFDFQSFEGKGAGVILNLFKNKSIPIFLINGATDLPPNIKLPKNVKIINLIDFFKTKEESIKNFRIGLAKAAEIAITHLKK